MSNGEEFKGMFRKDEIDGKGCFTTKRKERVEGVWANNILV